MNSQAHLPVLMRTPYETFLIQIPAGLSSYSQSAASPGDISIYGLKTSLCDANQLAEAPYCCSTHQLARHAGNAEAIAGVASMHSVLLAYLQGRSEQARQAMPLLVTRQAGCVARSLCLAGLFSAFSASTGTILQLLTTKGLLQSALVGARIRVR